MLNTRISFQEIPPLALKRGDNTSKLFHNDNLIVESIEVEIAEEGYGQLEEEKAFNFEDSS